MKIDGTSGHAFPAPASIAPVFNQSHIPHALIEYTLCCVLLGMCWDNVMCTWNVNGKQIDSGNVCIQLVVQIDIEHELVLAVESAGSGSMWADWLWGEIFHRYRSMISFPSFNPNCNHSFGSWKTDLRSATSCYTELIVSNFYLLFIPVWDALLLTRGTAMSKSPQISHTLALPPL